MYVRKRNTTSKIKDVERLVLEGIDSITPEAWANCVRHVKAQEDYFWECDSKFEALQNESLEEIEFGSLEEILAPDVAAFKFQNRKGTCYCATYSDPNLDIPFQKSTLFSFDFHF